MRHYNNNKFHINVRVNCNSWEILPIHKYPFAENITIFPILAPNEYFSVDLYYTYPLENKTTVSVIIGKNFLN